MDMQGTTVAIVLFDGVKFLDVTGPAEVFAEANRSGADYVLRFVSPDGRPVRTSVGLTVPVDASLADLDAPDVLLVAGGDDLVDRSAPDGLVEGVRAVARSARTVASVCTGAFVLAQAGLLAGRRATTHWRHAGLLARVAPDTEVTPDSIWVQDGDVVTSAGVTAGIDLALALVERDHGGDLARDVARALVVHMQRPGGQAQFSAGLRGPAPRSSPVRSVVDVVLADPASPFSTRDSARAVGVSARHLARLFVEELGTTPVRFVERARVDLGRQLLEQGSTVAEAAHGAGFTDPAAFRRAFRRVSGTTPSAHRHRFGTTGIRPPDSR
ncbi:MULTISPECIES: GlxA family transcriptional regulator [unclassified Curtobacterium]|uniref:GlxA family transcriptional regulator n=1 Tax=unclassified Curtobacterium TaxID=257496 RepID=UPI0027878D8F|nr:MULTISPECIES: GlxA family transcriptional regulator [unclassified Curtobacterium]MDP9736146.1 transcriptional regulator GlxA family with amidase domain [Curtobacterium sp. 260]MDR6170397.1 transcriptional regulator GlxA family with amidase domain [Curtobacterium sp. SORGH_AS_0776]